MRYKRKLYESLLLYTLKPLVFLYVRKLNKFNVEFIGCTRDINKPTILLGNHTFLADPVVISQILKRVPVPVASQTTMSNKLINIAFRLLIKPITIKIGAKDSSVVRNIRKCLKDGQNILMYPEASTTFYGETREFSEATAKLIKMNRVDVICIKTSGGYLGTPRWADYKRNRSRVDITFEKVIDSSDVKSMDVSSIDKIIKRSLYNNDYEWQENNKVIKTCDNSAVGIRRAIYRCYKCSDTNTVYGDGNQIICKNCGVIGVIDEFGFIQESKYNNLIDYKKFQDTHASEIVNQRYTLECDVLEYVNKSGKSVKKASGLMILSCSRIMIVSSAFSKNFIINKIEFPNVGMKKVFTFKYENEDYIFHINHYALLMDYIRMIKGDDYV